LPLRAPFRELRLGRPAQFAGFTLLEVLSLVDRLGLDAGARRCRDVRRVVAGSPRPRPTSADPDAMLLHLSILLDEGTSRGC
jgi:hypothetical protein